MPERYHENFVIYDKDLCKHWKNGFFCDKIDRKSVLWTHTSQTVTGKREREKVEFMSLAVVTLKKGEGRFLKSGGLWVYDNEIASIMGSFVNGDIVLVRDFDGYPMGRGFINTNSKITVRMLTRDERTEISPEFLKQRVRDAWEYRKKVVDTGSCRVIFGEADFLPGLVVDKFSDVLVVQSLALGIDRLKETIIDALKEVLAEDGIRIRGVYERSDAKVRRQEGMELTKGFIGEEFPTLVQIEENGVKYEVDIRDGQKTGFFLDQKYNRLAIQKLCKGAKVLDCFTHTGSFALNAGIAGAQSVLGVDASETAVLHHIIFQQTEIEFKLYIQKIQIHQSLLHLFCKTLCRFLSDDSEVFCFFLQLLFAGGKTAFSLRQVSFVVFKYCKTLLLFFTVCLDLLDRITVFRLQMIDQIKSLLCLFQRFFIDIQLICIPGDLPVKIIQKAVHIHQLVIKCLQIRIVL